MCLFCFVILETIKHETEASFTWGGEQKLRKERLYHRISSNLKFVSTVLLITNEGIVHIDKNNSFNRC